MRPSYASQTRQIFPDKTLEAQMRYDQLAHLSNPQFKRLCGVSRDTFAERVEVLRPHQERQGQRSGQAKLSVEEQLLVALEYWL